jgi:hypothetical protein
MTMPSHKRMRSGDFDIEDHQCSKENECEHLNQDRNQCWDAERDILGGPKAQRLNLSQYFAWISWNAAERRDIALCAIQVSALQLARVTPPPITFRPELAVNAPLNRR